jgi:Uma2 family endonuclease
MMNRRRPCMSTAVLPPPIAPGWTPSALRNPQPVRWTVTEFYDMGDRGWFDQKRVMLIDGVVLEMPLANPPHATSEGLTEDVLRRIFVTGFVVRTEKPLPLGQSTDPVPDVAVVAGAVRDFAQQHPTTAVLVVEVAESSLDYDTSDKASLYAAAGIADYWVVDLVNRRLVVMRDPIADATARHGSRFATVNTFVAGQSVGPLAAPGSLVAVTDLLP